MIKRNFWTKTEIGFVKEREAQILKERSEAQKSYPNAPADLFWEYLLTHLLSILRKWSKESWKMESYSNAPKFWGML